MSLEEIERLHKEAAQLAERVDQHLHKGDGASQLLENLRAQAKIVELLHTQIVALAEAQLDARSIEVLERLKGSLQSLVGQVDQNVKTAQSKGVRISTPSPPRKNP